LRVACKCCPITCPTIVVRLRKTQHTSTGSATSHRRQIAALTRSDPDIHSTHGSLPHWNGCVISCGGTGALLLLVGAIRCRSSGSPLSCTAIHAAQFSFKRALGGVPKKSLES